MSSITIRQLDDRLKARLRLQAARHGRSMEEQARQILKEGLAKEEAAPPNLEESIRHRLAPLGGVELPLGRREPLRRPPRLAK